jgi:hypothetical protein
MNSSIPLRRVKPVISSGAAPGALMPTSAARAWQILVVVGVALAVIGWVDVALLWIPLRFGIREWEFGVIAQSLQAMPLGTLGLVLLAAGGTARGSRMTLGVLAPVFGFITVAVFGLSIMFSLAALEGWGAVGPEMRQSMGKAILKTSVLAVTYQLFYAWLSVVSIRWAGRTGSGS